MVGGSVNGRPFREDPTSYMKTGIPCGNPKRFASRGVVRMVPNRHTAFEDQRLDMPPSEKMETEGERQFKLLLDKQLNTTVTIHDVMTQKREFKKSFSYRPVTEQVSGKFSLDEFKELERAKDQRDHLQQCGLAEQEMILHLQSVEDKSKKKKINPDVLEERLVQIRQKIQAKNDELNEPVQFRDLHYVTRHEMEIERTLKPNSLEARVFEKLVTEKPPEPNSHPDDPINHLKQMESDMFSHLQEGKRKRRKRKRSERERRLAEDPERATTSEPRVNVSHRKTSSTVRDEAETGPVTDAEIRSNRLSIEEIVQLPRFQDYIPGDPSKVLYIKNLARNAQLDDLEMLFQRFTDDSKESPTIKLMHNRMRGQAFVTFKSTETASGALDLLNGYQLKGKPLIICFGKHVS